MNFKMKALVAAVALTASMSASADIATATNGNGELVFSVWDATEGSESSYSRDLGVDLTSFLSGTTAGSSWDYAADATFTSWYNSLTATAQSGLQWNIMAGDASGARRGITTAVVDGLVASTSFTQAQARAAMTPLDTVISGLNAAMPGNLVADNLSTVIEGSATTGYAGYTGSNWGGWFNLSSTAAGIGDSLNLYSFTAASFGNAAIAAPITQLAFDGTSYKATFTSNGLSIAAVSAVPEADSWAMLLAGLGLMGFIARRRTAA